MKVKNKIYPVSPEFLRYLDAVGGYDEAAKRLGVSYAQIAHLKNGVRRITPDFARKIHTDSGGFIDKAKLVFPEDYEDERGSNGTNTRRSSKKAFVERAQADAVASA